MSDPSLIPLQLSHSSQGVNVGAGALRQFKHLAKIRAVVVLPTPRAPVKRYACPMRSDWIAPAKPFQTFSWPTSCSKFCGRYLSATT
ncbi:MAG: hypothetical protein QM811_24075 [Pirellulales bacterium]